MAALVGRHPDLEIIGLAATGEEAIQMFRTRQPDVTLMDLELPRMSGLDALRAILRENPEARIIVVTMHQGEEDVYQALAAGARAYLLKDTLPEELAATIRRVHAGLRPLPPEVEAKLALRASHATLSPREAQIVALIARGMRNKQIATELGISAETVAVHVKKLFLKLQVSDRTAAVAVAVRRGIIHRPS
jgi:two-component system NarL family response regulator